MKCAVITPVGPGHQTLIADCRRSVELAWQQNRGPFTAVEHLVVDDTRGTLGRSRARNQAVQTAQARAFDWLFFLDADDVLLPSAFAEVEPFHRDRDAIWGNIAEASGEQGQPSLRAPQIITLHCLAELLLHDPYRTLQMGHFVRTVVAARYPFDETLDTGEDFHYYLRVWENERCAKIQKVFFVNRRGRHSTGPRSADGKQWREVVTQLVSESQQRARLNPASSDARQIVNAKSLEYRDYLHQKGLQLNAKTSRALSRTLPYHGTWTVACYDCPPFLIKSENDDPVVNSIIWTGSFETNAMATWLRLTAVSGTILDIGGDTGVYTIAASAKTRGSTVLCLEPRDRNCARIRENLALNALTNVRVLPVAAGDTNGKVSLHVPVDDDLLTSVSAVGNDPASQSKCPPTVPMITVDTLAQTEGLERVSLVRISVGDAVPSVLRGMTSLLDRDHPNILLGVTNAEVGTAIAALLQKRGYRFYQIMEKHSALRSIEILPGTSDRNDCHYLVTVKSPGQLAVDHGIAIQ